MNTMIKSVAAFGAAGLLAVAAASPVEAKSGRNAAAVGGFIAGAAVGAAVAGSASRNYYAGPGYYEPGPYAYEGPVYVAPAPRRCWIVTDSSRGYGYYGRC